MMYHCYKLNNSKTEHISHIAWERLSVSNIVSCHGYCCRSCLIWCQLLLKRSTCKEASLDFSVFHTRCFLLIDVVSCFIASILSCVKVTHFAPVPAFHENQLCMLQLELCACFTEWFYTLGILDVSFSELLEACFAEFYPLLVSASTIWHICGCDSAVVFNIFNIFTVVIFWFDFPLRCWWYKDGEVAGNIIEEKLSASSQ